MGFSCRTARCKLTRNSRGGERDRNLRPWLNVINGECLSSVPDMRLSCVVFCRLSLPHRGGESLNRLLRTVRPFEGEFPGAEKDDGP